MSVMRLFFISIIIAIVGCQNSVGAVDEPITLANTNGTSTEIKPDDQLMINKTSLLQGANEELRIKAATLILLSDNPMAREILIEILRQPENTAARMAICKTLIQTKLSKQEIKNENDFIQPLLSVLNTENDEEAQLAAETTLIFNYDQIGNLLENLATDPNKPNKTRINAINALKIRSDMMAAIRLIKLVDDSNRQVANEAEKALSSIGISVGADPNSRRQNIDEIIKRGEVSFLQTRLSSQNSIIRAMRSQMNMWQKRYISELENTYKNISDDKVKGEFLAKYLKDSEVTIKEWALDKAYQWRNAPGPMGMPAELGPIFLNLISDQNKNIRLKTAKLLAISVDVNSVRPLLAQLEIENDNQVKSELLVALGEACYIALPNPPDKITPELAEERKKILEWAAKFLFMEDVEMARRGAEVLKKLLKRDGLQPEDVDKYLNLLAERYNSQDNNPNTALKGQLLSAMTGLCAQDCTYKSKAGILFDPLFRKSLQDRTDFIREIAIDGLIYIDKPNALGLLRSRNDILNDPSEKIRKRLIELADEVGGKDDLSWLSEKINSNSEGEPAWQAMLKIFKGSDVNVIKDWTGQLTSQSGRIKLTDIRQIDFLRIAESKVGNEDKSIIRKKLAELYMKNSDYERASDYYNMLYKSAQTDEEKDTILPDLINAYLKSSKIDPVIEYFKQFLQENDIDPNNVMAKSIDSYFVNPNNGADPNEIYKRLSEIEITQPKPEWNKWLEVWAAQLNIAKETKKQKQNVN